MKRTRAGLAILVLLAAVLVALPALAGCGGGGGGEEIVIKIGVMADFTGTAGSAMQPTIQAFEDYLEKIVPNSSNPLPQGVKVEFVPFDTQLKYEKTVPGYLYLKGQGVKMMVVMNAQDRELLGTKPDQDGMPTIGTMGLQSMIGDEWMLTTWSPIQSQGEVEMLFIMDDWDYTAEGRSPVVGHLGYTLSSSSYYQEGIQKVIDANPGKFAWGGFERGALTTVQWTSEIGRLTDKGCDYIIVSVAGPLLSSFVSQARAAGYEGKFITGMEGFPGFWPLVTGSVGSKAQLHGCYYVAWWRWWNEVDTVPLIQDCLDYIDEYRGGSAELKGTSSVISGRELGIALEAALRNAIEAVGAENVDGSALKDGLRAIDISNEAGSVLEGYLDHWQVTPNTNCLQWSQRAFEYSLTEEVWKPLPTVYHPTLTRPAG
jgi:Periplasmic binding protein